MDIVITIGVGIVTLNRIAFEVMLAVVIVVGSG